MTDFYARLLELRRAEAASRGLAKLPNDFYAQAEGYLAEARRTYETELRENPSGRKGEVARQTHGRALQIARDLVESRTSKILSAAFQAAVGGSRELPNALPEERALHARLVDAIREFRARSTPCLEPGAPSTPAVLPRPAEEPVRPPVDPPVATPTARPPSAPPPTYVRILKASPPIELGGETLELRPEEIVSVSAEIARILVDGKVAERVVVTDRSLDG